MEKRWFYTRIENGNALVSLDVDDIYELAKFAATLEFKGEGVPVFEVDKNILALSDYCKSNDDNYSRLYNLIGNSVDALNFLFLCIQLAVLRKSFNETANTNLVGPIGNAIQRCLDELLYNHKKYIDQPEWDNNGMQSDSLTQLYSESIKKRRIAK